MNKRRMSDSTPVASVLGRDSTLSALIQRASELNTIQQNLKATLPPTLRDHFILANVSNQALTVHTDSQAWASKLRFLSAELLRDAQLHCSPYKPRSVRIKVVPAETATRLSKQTASLSEDSARNIRDTAASMPESELKTALLRLSKNR